MIFVCIIRIDALWLVDCGGWYGAMMAVVEIIVVYMSSMHLLKKYTIGNHHYFTVIVIE